MDVEFLGGGNEVGRLGIYIAIDGSGRAADNTDLDLQIRNSNGSPLADARSENSVESLSGLPLPAGWYIIHVRDGGGGNRAAYRLTVRAQPRP